MKVGSVMKAARPNDNRRDCANSEAPADTGDKARRKSAIKVCVTALALVVVAGGLAALLISPSAVRSCCHWRLTISSAYVLLMIASAWATQARAIEATAAARAALPFLISSGTKIGRMPPP